MTTSAAVITGSIALVGGLRRRRWPCVEPVLAVTEGVEWWWLEGRTQHGVDVLRWLELSRV
jgi:hypothetical protein